MNEVKRYTAWAAEVALPRGTMVVLAADYDALIARADADFLVVAEYNVEQRKTIQRLQAELATERLRADVAVKDANDAERRVAELETGHPGEVIAEHNGCGRGIQVDNIIVRLCPGDKVIMIRGPIGRVLCSAGPKEDKS